MTNTFSNFTLYLFVALGAVSYTHLRAHETKAVPLVRVLDFIFHN